MQLHILLLPGGVDTTYQLFPDLVAAVLFGLLIGIACTLIWHSKKVSVLEDLHASEVEAMKLKTFELQQMLEGNESDKAAVEKENELLKNENARLKRAAAEKPVPVAETNRVREQTFFMSQPNRNGRFLESGRHSELEKAIYKFQVMTDNPGVANFEFVARDVYLKVALGNEPTWINIACERNNTPGDRTTQVKTLSPGQAVLHGDEWEITRKAKITYL